MSLLSTSHVLGRGEKKGAVANDDESPGHRASEHGGGPLTRGCAPTMLKSVRFATEFPEDPRTAAVCQPRGETV